MEENKIKYKNFIWNTIGATFSAFNSFLFAIIVTRINGVNDAGIFTYSFATACLLYVIGLYLGRAFQVTDLTKENSDTDYIYNRITTCICMIIFSIIFVLIKRYSIYKSTIFLLLCLFKCIEAFTESIYSIIQKNEELYKVGISLFIKSLVSLLAFAIINYCTKNLTLSCVSIIIVNIFVFIIYDFKNLKRYEIIKTKYTNKANIRLLKNGFYTFVFTFLSIYVINAPRYAIDDILSNDLQTIFSIIIMPATFMGLLGQYIIQPILTKISKILELNEYKKLLKLVLKLVIYMILIGTGIFIIAYFLESPILSLVYGINLQPYNNSMMIIIIGSIFYSLSIILSAILIAMRKTFEQVIIYAIASILATILSYNLVDKVKIQGASVTYLITMFIIAVSFMFYIIYNINKKIRGIKNENINNNSNI